MSETLSPERELAAEDAPLAEGTLVQILDKDGKAAPKAIRVNESLTSDGKAWHLLAGSEELYPREALRVVGGEVPDASPESAPDESPRQTAEAAVTAVREVMPVSDDMQAMVEAHLAAHPEVAAETAEGLQHLEANQNKAVELDKKLAEVAGSGKEESREESRTKQGVRATMSRFFRSLRERFSRKTGEGSSAAPENSATLKTEVSEVAAHTIEASQNIQGPEQTEALAATANAAFDQKREELVASGEQVKLTGEQLIQKAHEKLAGLMQSSDIEGLERAQAYFEKLKANDALDGFTLGKKAMSSEDISTHINMLLAATVNTQMDEQIEQVFSQSDEKLRNGGYRELSKVLTDYLKMSRLGSKKGLEVKMFFSKILKAKLKEVAAQKDGKVKALLLKHFLEKHELA